MSRGGSMVARVPSGSVTMAEVRSGTEPKWWTLLAVCVGTFMLMLDVSIVNVALPQIQSSLHSSFSDLQWVVDAYALSLASLLLTAGSLADLLGRRVLWLIGLCVFTVSSVFCGAAQSPLMLEISRAVQGVGGAVMLAVSLALLAQAFRGKERGLAFGVWGSVSGVAVAAGPVVGGLIVTTLSWRYIFFVNVPLGVLVVIVSLTRVAESRAGTARRPDLQGFGLFTAALAVLVYGLIESSTLGFGSGIVIGCLLAATVLLIAFVAVERRSEHAMFDLGLLRLPTFAGGSIAAFGVSSTIVSMFLYLVLYLQDLLGYSALQTGLRLLYSSGGVLTMAWISGRLSARVPLRVLIGFGLLLVAVGLLLMRGLQPATSWSHLIPGLLISGMGIGFVNPSLASTAVGVVRAERSGMASGINSTFRQVGVATGIALLGTLFSNALSSAVLHGTAGTPLASSSARIATAMRDGAMSRLVASTPARERQLLVHVLKQSFTSAMNEILLVAAIISFITAVLAIVLIRRKDLHSDARDDGEGEGRSRVTQRPALAGAQIAPK